MSDSHSQIAKDIFSLELPSAREKCCSFIAVEFPPFLKEVRSSERFASFIDFYETGSDIENAAWVKFAHDNYLDPHLLRMVAVLSVGFGRLADNPDDDHTELLRFCLHMKRELALYLRHQHKLQSISPNDIALIEHLGAEIKKSPLADYEASLDVTEFVMPKEYTFQELRQLLL